MATVIVRLDTDNVMQTDSLSINNEIRTFTDCDSCVDFITDDQSHSVVLILTSCFDPKYLVSILHLFTNISAIYCHNKSEWTRNYSKVKLILGHIDFSTVKLVENGPRNDNQDAAFMFAELAKEILIADTSNDRQECIDMCRRRSPKEAKFIDEFERNYSLYSPIYWYTRQSPLFNMLNQALRTHDSEVLYAMRFFIRDLYKKLQELQENISPENFPFIVYRGQDMSREDFEGKLKNKVNGLLSISTFWSTSRDSNVANVFIDRDESNGFEAILFEIEIDSIKISPFADIENQSANCDESEVLLSAGSVFRIDSIVQNMKKQWHVKLKLTNSDTDADLNKVGKNIRAHMGIGINTLERLGHLTALMGDYVKARNIYVRMIDECKMPEHELHIAYLYNKLAWLYDKMSFNANTIIFCSEKALEIQHKYLPANHQLMWESYNNLGIIYRRMGNYDRALDYYSRCECVEDPELLAATYNNIGTLMKELNKFDGALKYLELAYTTTYHYTSSIDSSLTSIGHNIASVYLSKRQFLYALDIAKNALDIQQRSALDNHPTTASIHETIARIYVCMNQHHNAVDHIDQAIAITPMNKQQKMQEFREKILQGYTFSPMN